MTEFWVLEYCAITPLNKRAMNIFDLPRGAKTEFHGFSIGDENFANAIHYIHAMSPDEFMRFCRAMVELRYDAEQNGLAAVAEYLRRKRAN